MTLSARAGVGRRAVVNTDAVSVKLLDRALTCSSLPPVISFLAPAHPTTSSLSSAHASTSASASHSSSSPSSSSASPAIPFPLGFMYGHASRFGAARVFFAAPARVVLSASASLTFSLYLLSSAPPPPLYFSRYGPPRIAHAPHRIICIRHNNPYLPLPLLSTRHPRPQAILASNTRHPRTAIPSRIADSPPHPNPTSSLMTLFAAYRVSCGYISRTEYKEAHR